MAAIFPQARSGANLLRWFIFFVVEGVDLLV